MRKIQSAIFLQAVAVLTVGSLIQACGGTAIVDHQTSSTSSSSNDTDTTDTISTGSGTTSTGSGTTSTGSTTGSTGTKTDNCAVLGKAYRDALAEARSCNVCTPGPPPCAYPAGEPLIDECGCAVPTGGNIAAVQTAQTALNAWRAAGCLVTTCELPCVTKPQPSCEDLSNSCLGRCIP